LPRELSLLVRLSSPSYFLSRQQLVWSFLVPGYCCRRAACTPISRLVIEYQKLSIDLAARCAASRPGLFHYEGMDRRNHKRFEVVATARFSWTDLRGNRWRGRGRTRDISETGVFVVTPDCPPSGATVRLEVRAASLSRSGLMMQAKGQVVRVEVGKSAPAIAGFAAATRSLKLRDCKPGFTARTSHLESGQSRKPN